MFILLFLFNECLSHVLTSTGIIKLKNNGDFFIANEGRRPIYIDGRPVLSGNKWKLNNNSVVEVCGQSQPWLNLFIYIWVRHTNVLCLSLQIAGLRFVFLINLELISLIKAEAAKMTQQWMSAIRAEDWTCRTYWRSSQSFCVQHWLTVLSHEAQQCHNQSDSHVNLKCEF